MATNDEQDYEIESGCLEATAPFAKLYGAELYDSRMNSEQKILLMALRFRLGPNVKLWAAFETIAKDLGMSPRQVRENAKVLKELGLLTCDKRGLSQTHVKRLPAPSKAYDPEVFASPYHFMRTERTEEDIFRLRSVPAENRRTAVSAENRLSTGGKSPHIPAGISRSEVDTSEAASVEIASSRDAAASQQLHPGVGDQPIANHEENPSDTGSQIHDAGNLAVIGSSTSRPRPVDSRPAFDLAAVADKSRASTAAMLAKREEARRARQLAMEADNRATASAARRKRSKFESKDGRSNCYDAQAIFMNLKEEHFPDSPVGGTWIEKDLSFAKKLIEAWGFGLVEEVFTYCFVNWKKICEARSWQSQGPGISPTIKWIFSNRDEVVSEVKAKKISPVRDLNDL